MGETNPFIFESRAGLETLADASGFDWETLANASGFDWETLADASGFDWKTRSTYYSESNFMSSNDVSIRDFQNLIKQMYYDKDVERGIDGTFMWLMEEIGELATALRSGSLEEQSLEFADVIAWLTTIANVAGVDLAAAVQRKYGTGCPGCAHLVCTCDMSEKP